MGYLRLIIISMFIFLFSSIPVSAADILGVAVEKFRVPVDAPDFALKALGGTMVTLKEFRGKVVLLNFFTLW